MIIYLLKAFHIENQKDVANRNKKLNNLHEVSFSFRNATIVLLEKSQGHVSCPLKSKLPLDSII